VTPLAGRLGVWFGTLSRREQTLCLGAAGVVAAVIVLLGARAVRDELGRLEARVAGHERQLAEVRRLAATLTRTAHPGAEAAADESSLFARLEAAAHGVLGRDRLAGMTPASAPAEDGLVEERVALQVRSASLADAVRLLHELESGSPAVHVTRLELRKQPDDATGFSVVLEAAELREAP
jgi:hypothetical protein